MLYDPSLYQITAIKVALRAYARHGMKVNRAYTPKNMLAKATELTGVTFKRGEYLRAADELEKLSIRLQKEMMAARSIERAKDDLGFGRVM